MLQEQHDTLIVDRSTPVDVLFRGAVNSVFKHQPPFGVPAPHECRLFNSLLNQRLDEVQSDLSLRLLLRITPGSRVDHKAFVPRLREKLEELKAKGVTFVETPLLIKKNSKKRGKLAYKLRVFLERWLEQNA